MNEHVMVRFPQLGRDTILRRAQVLSRKGNTLRVKIEDMIGTREVQASQTLPERRAGGRPDGRGQSLPIQAFPASPHALANRW